MSEGEAGHGGASAGRAGSGGAAGTDVGGSGGQSVGGNSGVAGEEAGSGGGGSGGGVSLDAGAADARATDAGPSDAGARTFTDELVAWNGDGVGDANASHWMGRGQDGLTTIGGTTTQSHSPTHAIAFAMHQINYGEFGWSIRSVPANKYKYLVFWVNMVRDAGKVAPGNALVTVKVGGNYAAPGGGRGVSTLSYNKTALQGGWQQVVIPVTDIVGASAGSAGITELLVGIAGCGTATCSFTLYVDDIGFAS